MQTKKQSRNEAIVNIIVGLIYAFIINYILLQFPFASKAAQAGWITALFTFASFVRQYYMRRFFNWWDHKDVNRQHQGIEDH